MLGFAEQYNYVNFDLNLKFYNHNLNPDELDEIFINF